MMNPLSHISGLPRQTSLELAREERALIEAALKGDGRAFAALVRPHLPMLLRIATRATGDGALGEDAVQEALTIAFQSLRKYEPGTSLKAHLAAIAVRRAYTLSRSERRRGQHEGRAPLPASSDSAQTALEKAEQAKLVRQALEAMPEKRREASLLRLEGELSYAEIASAMDTTEGSARVLVHLALKELKTRLAFLIEGAGHDGQTEKE